MKRIALRAPKRAQGSICQFCQFSTSRSRQLASQYQALLLRTQRFNPSNDGYRRRDYPRNFNLSNAPTRRFASETAAALSVGGDPDSMLRSVLQDSRSIMTAPTLPTEETVVELLERCKAIVNIALSDNIPVKQSEDSATSSLLGLEDENNNSKSRTAAKVTPNKTFRQRATIAISSMLNELLRDPKVFISPKILEAYTDIQSQLKRPDHFPEIFSLYATKPAAQANGSTITYRTTNSKTAKNAIPQEFADMALDIAIEQKNLPLALAIVDKTFCAPSFQRAKILRKASLPIAGLIGMPPAAYAAASYASTFQNTMNPSTSTWIAFSAILAYITFTSSIGLVAIATANDQMRRVVWLPGIPLRQRWLREEERAAMDKIAMAWGFKDPWMQGEEEGEEWENLREFLGMRGMILDKTDLMDGME